MQALKLVLCYFVMAEVLAILNLTVKRGKGTGWWLSHFAKALLLWPLFLTEILFRRKRWYNNIVAFFGVMVWAFCRLFSLVIGEALVERIEEPWLFCILSFMLIFIVGDIIWWVLAYLGTKIFQKIRKPNPLSLTC